MCRKGCRGVFGEKPFMMRSLTGCCRRFLPIIHGDEPKIAKFDGYRHLAGGPRTSLSCVLCVCMWDFVCIWCEATTCPMRRDAWSAHVFDWMFMLCFRVCVWDVKLGEVDVCCRSLTFCFCIQRRRSSAARVRAVAGAVSHTRRHQSAHCRRAALWHPPRKPPPARGKYFCLLLVLLVCLCACVLVIVFFVCACPRWSYIWMTVKHSLLTCCALTFAA